MGKVWLKSVDPARQICSCAGKTSPCSTCLACTGFRYDPVHNWSGADQTAFLFTSPPSNCLVTQDAADSYNRTSASILSSIPATLPIGSGAFNDFVSPSFGRNPTYRNDGVTILVNSGDVIRVNMLSTNSSDSLYTTFTTTGIAGDENYGFIYASYNGNQRGGIWNRGVGTFGTVIESDFSSALASGNPWTPGSSLGSSFGGPNPLQTVTLANAYVSSNRYPLYIGGLFYTGFVPPLSLQTASLFTHPQSCSDIEIIRNLPTAFQEPGLSYATRCFDGGEAHTSWKCNKSGPGGNWALVTGYAFGNYQADVDAWNALIGDFVSNEPTLTNGNRGLCFKAGGYPTDPTQTGAFLSGPSQANPVIPCTPANDGQIITYPGVGRTCYYYTTSWPTTTYGPISSGNFMRFQVTKSACINIASSIGGLWPLAVYNDSPTTNPLSTEHYTGYARIAESMTITNETSPLTVISNFFYTGNYVQVACPYALP